MIADMLSNKKLNPMVTKLSIRRRKLNISVVSITQSYFVVPKSIKLNSTYYFVMKIPSKRELQQIAFNHWIRYWLSRLEDMNLYKKCTVKPGSFLVIDTTLASYNSSRFRNKREYKSLSWQLMIKLKMKNYSAILTKKQQKLSAFSSGKIDKYEYLTGE